MTTAQTVSNVTDSVVDFICETDPASIPVEVREEGRRALLDTIGVALAGTAEPTSQIVVKALASNGNRGDITIVGTNHRTTAPDAALANGTSAHALDYDDVHPAMGHPSAPLTAAVLATAELQGASGADMITAFLLGFEVECKIGRGMGRSHYQRGFHSTSTHGVLGASAAASRLLKLDKLQTRNALGIAGSMASGLRANFGSMTKPFHVGNAAHGGVLSAMLAQGGFTAADAIFDGPLAFTRVFSPDSDGDIELIRGFGETWEATDPGIAVKKYPCCYASHRAADAILTIVNTHSPKPEEIESIEVRLPEGRVNPDGGVGPMIHPQPKTGLQGKFSMQYVMSSAIFDHELKLGNFVDEQVLRPQVQEFMRRVTPLAEVGRSGDNPATSYTEVAVRLKDGRELSERVFYPRGDAAGGEPLSWNELAEKYRDCAALALPEGKIERSLDMLHDLESLQDVRSLMAELALDGK